MFARADAAEIRRGLGELDFTSANAEPSSSAFDAYFKFYKFAPSVIGAESSHTAGAYTHMTLTTIYSM